MNDSVELAGKCLCGAVSFSARARSRDVAACHCSMCRHWTGGPFLCIELEEPAAFSGENYISVYKSSSWAERGFCKLCGSTLFWRMHGGGHYAISAGALDSSEGLNLALQIFIDEKPDYYDFANKSETMTGAEVEAQFNADGGEEAAGSR